MRLFIAIRLSDEMRKALVQCMHDLKKQGSGRELCPCPEPAYDFSIYRGIQGSG